MGNNEKVRRGPKPGPRAEYKLSTSRLIHKIWERYGGVVEIGEKVGLSNQSLVAYAKVGRVPYEHIGDIARALGHLSVWGFDYNGLLRLQGSAPEWNDVVNSYNLSETDINFILKGARPKETL